MTRVLEEEEACARAVRDTTYSDPIGPNHFGAPFGAGKEVNFNVCYFCSTPNAMEFMC